MAANPRFEIPSSSPDGSNFTAGYSNGQRSHFSGASNLERSSSFRENPESRILTAGPNLARGGGLPHGENLPLLQVMLSDTLSMSMSDQKYSHQLELRRVTNAALGTVTEDQLLGAVKAKPLASLGPEELKRVRASVTENSLKARERLKILNEAICKLEKHCLPSMSNRKRSRTDISGNERTNTLPPVDRSAVGGNLMKTGSQNHATSNSVDIGSQKSEDRNKNILPNKRVRTSMMDIRLEGRSNNSARPSGTTEWERDSFRSGNAGLGQPEVKDRALPAGSDSWEKTKLKGRRSGIKPDVSVSTAGNRAMDGEREHKRAMQHRPNIDSRSRPSECHGFRSGPVNGIISMHKMENAAQPSSINVRAMARNEHDGVALANEKRDRLVGLEKERAVLKGSIKPNIRDENHAASPTTITKGKASRGPRSSSGASTNSSSHFPRTSSTFDGWERSTGVSRVQLSSATTNRKRPAPTRSSSPPVAQWVGQRPTKMSRIARRTNLVPPVSNRDDMISLAEALPNPDTGAKPNSIDSNGPSFPKRSSNNNAIQQSKLKTENVSSSAGLSESEESGAGENKSKEKSKKQGDTEEKVVSVSQKVGALVLPSKKTKIVTKEESGDGVRRQGRSGRSLALVRTGVPPTGGKIENTTTAKQLRSTRPGPDKVESKTGRPPSKKISSDRKPFTRPRRPINSGSSDFTGESDDDHEELLAAADAAVNASCIACSGTFWKQMEPFFSFLSQEDVDYLKQQVRQLDEADATLLQSSGRDQNGKVDLRCSTLPASPSSIILGKQRSFANGNMDSEASRLLTSLNDMRDIEKLSGKCTAGRWLDKMLPLSQRLLAALIIEDDTDEASRIQYDARQDEYFQCMGGDSPSGTCSQLDSETKDADRVESEVESEVELKIRKQTLDRSPIDCHTPSNGHRNYALGNCFGSDEARQEEDILVHSEIGILNGNFRQLDVRDARGGQKVHDEPEPNYEAIGMISGIASYEVQYKQMCLDERILLELQSVGLFPDLVPDLAQREDEEIKEDICKLQGEHQQQVSKIKGQVYNLEKAVFKRREIEDREREHMAMNKLVEMAYNRHMGCRGTNSGGKSAGNKAAKQAALAFVKRTLSKCRKFDETGRSCFTEGSLRERIFCISSRETDMVPLYVTEEETANAFTGTTVGPPDMKPSDLSVMVSEHPAPIVVQPTQKIENGERESSDTLQAAASSLEQTVAKDEALSIRVKKRELLLEDVVGGSILRGAPVLGSALLGGTKGKRSERDREGKGHSRDMLTRNGTAKNGRPGMSNAKGERKTKPKPRQKTAQLSAAANGLLGKPTETPKGLVSMTVSNPCEKAGDKIVKVNDELISSHTPSTTAQDLSHDTEGAIDLSHLQLPGMEDLVVTDDIGGQGQDLGSWLNFDDDGLQDGAGDFMGLDVPMDDLSDLGMMV